jgi:hypothetical protein
MSRSAYLTIALLIVLGATVLRTLWLRADPPTTSVGIVFHDEGPWTHNARNQALWGVWQTDNWNPVYIAPSSPRSSTSHSRRSVSALGRRERCRARRASPP